MMLIYSYQMLNVRKEEITTIKLPAPKTLEQASLMLMKLNKDAEVYGAVYYMLETDQRKAE